MSRRSCKASPRAFAGSLMGFYIVSIRMDLQGFWGPWVWILPCLRRTPGLWPFMLVHVPLLQEHLLELLALWFKNLKTKLKALYCSRMFLHMSLRAQGGYAGPVDG